MRKSLTKAYPKEDRRTLKTKKALANALKSLVLEKAYDEITIQEIIDRANVGRSTFYMHYESKEQLLVGNINFQETLIYTPADETESYPMGINLAYLFSHSKEHLLIYNALSGNRSLDILGNYFTDICASKIMAHLKRQPFFKKSNEQALQYKAEAAAAGIIRMMFKWLKEGATIPSEKMIMYARDILRDFVSGDEHL
jgi:hypothetical protein